MPHIPTLLLAGLVLAGAPIRAQAHCHTRWEVNNRTGRELRVACVADGKPHLAMRTDEPVPAGGRRVHCWGDGHYNDGLGLEPAEWTCAVGTAPDPLSTPGATLFHFRTGWMEDVELVLEEQDGAVVVRKQRLPR
jgi:hypothetical protein